MIFWVVRVKVIHGEYLLGRFMSWLVMFLLFLYPTFEILDIVL